jgi:radical SAM superfamily enzyme
MSYKTHLQDNIFLEFSNSYKDKITFQISKTNKQKRKCLLFDYYYTFTNTDYDIESIIDMYLSV